MNELRLDDYLEHIESAAHRALEFLGSQSRDEFLADIKTQHAVAMSFAIMGEAATRIAATYPDFIASTAEISWRDMRGMRLSSMATSGSTTMLSGIRSITSSHRCYSTLRG